MHKKIYTTIVPVLLALASPALAAELAVNSALGTTIPQVQATLAGMGYQVRKTEMEDGRIEVYVVKGNQMGEIYVSTATGKVTALKVK